MARSLNLIVRAVPALCAMGLCAMAGDNEPHGIGRKEFHLSTDYPYVFRVASYLNTEGPEPMRYGEPAIDCTHRLAPALPQAAKGKEPEPAKPAEKSAAPSPAPTATSAPSPVPTTNPASDKESANSAAAYPVGANAPTRIFRSRRTR